MSGWAIVGATLAALWTLDGLRLRGRAKSLSVLSPSEAPCDPKHVFIARPGVTILASTMSAASAHARANGLLALDLVAPGLSSWRALLFLFTLDPGRCRSDLFARGMTAGDALLVDAGLLSRAGGMPKEVDPGSLLELARKLKRHAPRDCAVTLAPGITSPRLTFATRRAFLRMAAGELAAAVLAIQLLLLVSAIVWAPLYGIAALVSLHLQVFVITAGTKLRPADRMLFAATRALTDAFSAFGKAARLTTDAEAQDRRASYRARLAGGTAPFFEPARADCPLCGGHNLRHALEVNDRFQQKPGRFVLDRCRDCSHIFQNPRLSLEGLSFYYADFYDGMGENLIDGIFAGEMREYRSRAGMVAAAARPRRWLDVGAGHGHFCCVAREVLPETRFDGLDFSESIDEAAQRGWIDRGLRGLFPELAPVVAKRGDVYDVVSMSHYLEHTRDPRAEIAAAASVLDKDGLLFVEVPDPECRLGRWFGRRWMPWFQPQHQHFLSAKNLERVLREHAFEPLAWHRGEAHQPNDFTYMTLTTINCIAPRLDLPWRPPSGTLSRVWWHVVWSLALPLLIFAWLLDRALAPLFRRKGWSNSYRVLARRIA